MDCFVVQDWVTVRTPSGATSITQSEHAWLDLHDYRDVVLWTEVKEYTPGGGTSTLTYQTCSSQDDSLFMNIANIAATVGVTATTVHRATATVPLGRWLRWHLQVSGASSTTDLTFRVWVAVMKDR